MPFYACLRTSALCTLSIPAHFVLVPDKRTALNVKPWNTVCAIRWQNCKYKLSKILYRSVSEYVAIVNGIVS